MPSNIEIKARVRELDKLRSIAESIATEPGQIFHQEDVFFHTGKGRLKLRIFSDTTGELIHYERPDTCGAKLSRYHIYKTSMPNELRQLLSMSLGETITVKKKREVYTVGQTRIHLDEVDELGTFMELEVVLTPDQALEDGRTIVTELMKKLSIDETDLISGAYADILLARVEEDTESDNANVTVQL